MSCDLLANTGCIIGPILFPIFVCKCYTSHYYKRLLSVLIVYLLKFGVFWHVVVDNWRVICPVEARHKSPATFLALVVGTVV